MAAVKGQRPGKCQFPPHPPNAALLVRMGGPICIQNACASPSPFFSYLELTLLCVICKVDVIVIKAEATSREMKHSASVGYRLTSRSNNIGLLTCSLLLSNNNIPWYHRAMSPVAATGPDDHSQ